MSDEYTVRQTLTSRFGPATAERLIAGYQDTWIQASDLDNIKNLGLNVVRVPILLANLDNLDGTMRADADAFRKLDWLVRESAQRNLYLILDLHGAPGGSCPWHSCGQAGTNQLWTNRTYQDWTVQIWQRLAVHYQGNPTIAGYGLLNEPLLTDGDVEAAHQVAQKLASITPSIRRCGPSTRIISSSLKPFMIGRRPCRPPSMAGPM